MPEPTTFADCWVVRSSGSTAYFDIATLETPQVASAIHRPTGENVYVEILGWNAQNSLRPEEAGLDPANRDGPWRDMFPMTATERNRRAPRRNP